MATTTAERPNKVEISEIGPSLKKIRIEIPKETVAEQMGGQLETLLAEAELPGFRRGRAPKRLVEKRFGSVVRKQAKEQLIAKAYQQAIEEHKIRVLGEPSGDMIEKLEIEDGKSLAFEVEVEVLPEFELPELEGIEIRKPILTVTEEMTSKELERACIQEGTLEEREVAEAGDYLTGHATMVDPAGKVQFESDGIVVQVPPKDAKGKGMIVGLVVEDLGKQLGLPKAGDTVTVKTKGPDNHENEEVRAKAMTITYKPSRVDRIIPAKASELAQRVGLESEEKLKQIVADRLQQRVLVQQVSVMRAQLARHLVDKTKINMPERLSAKQSARSIERRRLELMYRGMDPQKIEENLAEFRTATTKNTQFEMKVFFILDRAAEQLGVKVSEQEINGRIAQIAMERNERPEKLRQQLISTNQVGGIFKQIREHKTLDTIIAKAKITELPVEEYNKLVDAEAQA